MAVLREPDLYTVDDFFAVIPDGQKADLIGGRIHEEPSETPRSNGITGFIQFLLDGYVSSRGLGLVFSHRVAFVLGDHDALEPDLAFLRAERRDRVGARHVDGGPDIAVEVVSRDSRQRDYVEKKRLYSRAGVSEYWLVDPLQRRVEFYRLEDGEYVLAPLERNRYFRSQAAPGFWLDIEWLFAEPLPSCMECLRAILAGEPAS